VNRKDPVLVVVQLSGGNDFMNTLIPYTSSVYYDARPVVGVAEEDVLPLDNTLGFHPSAGPLREMYHQGDVAVIQGVGYPEATRSHFRNMDTWHTCDAVKVGSEGWLGKAIRELDPRKENPLTGVNIGRGLPRALASPGVPVTSVGDLDNYGVMADIDERERGEALDVFKEMYGPAIGTGPVMDYLAQTGSDLLAGADAIKVAPQLYRSDVEYADNPIAKSLRDVAGCTWPIWARASSIQSTADTTRMPTSWKYTRGCWVRSPERLRTSNRTSRTTTPPKRS
jgi:uncharacterized protein (DUF1501 family)